MAESISECKACTTLRARIASLEIRYDEMAEDLKSLNNYSLDVSTLSSDITSLEEKIEKLDDLDKLIRTLKKFISSIVNLNTGSAAI